MKRNLSILGALKSIRSELSNFVLESIETRPFNVALKLKRMQGKYFIK